MITKEFNLLVCFTKSFDKEHKSNLHLIGSVMVIKDDVKINSLITNLGSINTNKIFYIVDIFDDSIISENYVEELKINEKLILRKDKDLKVYEDKIVYIKVGFHQFIIGGVMPAGAESTGSTKELWENIFAYNEQKDKNETLNQTLFIFKNIT